jgi:aspartyl-tRNA(Asn)/glutamyl-tRNA(Gln) amidotransferase subunit A
MDSIGTFTHSAEDGALVFAALSGEPVPAPRPLKGLRLGRPTNHYFDGLSAQVEAAAEGALAVLADAGVEIVPIEVPEAPEIDPVFGPIVSVELLATLGTERFLAAKEVLDPIVWNRAQPALELRATEYARLLARQRALCAIARERMRGLHGWVTPTTPDVPLPLGDRRTPGQAAAWIRRGTHATRPGNLFGQCGISIAIPNAALPVGLQVMCDGGEDRALLSISRGVERALGRRARADMSRFL